MRLIVDAHEDIAWNMLTFGRDPTRSVAETRTRESEGGARNPQGEALLGYPDYVRGGVAVAFATLNAIPVRRKLYEWETLSYSTQAEANRLSRAQADAYHRLAENHADKFQLVTDQTALRDVLETWSGNPPAAPRVGLVMMIEGADCVQEPQELDEWFAAGVRIVGPAWSGTRYCGGTREPGPLTPDGRRLLQGMDDLGMTLDLSHMAEQAYYEALDRFPGTIIASHSNARALLDGSPVPDRHLSDAMILRLVEREGVIGVVPYNRFLKGGWLPEDGRAVVTLEHVIRQIDHLCQLAGDAQHTGLGSDFDGGFGLNQLPTGLDSIADLRSIGESLARSGYQPADVEAILSGNWLRMLRRGLPES
jgi:membrane dipeptidase